MKRWVLLSTVGTVFHVLVSVVLFLGVFGFGMASFNSGNGKASRYLSRALTAWHAPYAYVWAPVASHLLPAVPPAEDVQEKGGVGGSRANEERQRKMVRIARVHTAVRNLGYVFSSIVGGCVLSGLYLLLQRRDEPSGPT